jgi:hypothetical protein
MGIDYLVGKIPFAILNEHHHESSIKCFFFAILNIGCYNTRPNDTGYSEDFSGIF